jgi:hypothetical protein
MRLRLLKPYGYAAPGDILPSVDKPVADLLVKRGVAVVIDDVRTPPNKMLKAGKVKTK